MVAVAEVSEEAVVLGVEDGLAAGVHETDKESVNRQATSHKPRVFRIFPSNIFRRSRFMRRL